MDLGFLRLSWFHLPVPSSQKHLAVFRRGLVMLGGGERQGARDWETEKQRETEERRQDPRERRERDRGEVVGSPACSGGP